MKNKNLLSVLLSLVMIVTVLPMTGISVFAEDGVAIDETSFPDANFRNYVKKNCDTDSNGALSNNEIIAVTKIVVNASGIKSLKGIEYFTALTELYCSDNQLTSLDVSKNTALTYLLCSHNQLTSLDVSGATALTELDCSLNQLTSLDVSKNTALEDLSCSYNQLTNLDISNNTTLIMLDCADNRLTSLNVSKNTALEYLFCSNNQITSLDVSKNTALTELDCSVNQITSLDISKNTELYDLNCSDNQLTNLDLSKNVNLWRLNCSENMLTSLGVSNNTELYSLVCSKNQLTSLDLSQNVNLSDIYKYDDYDDEEYSLYDAGPYFDIILDFSENSYNIKFTDNKTFDLSTLPGNFDVNKASHWVGGTVNGNILTVDKDATEVTYTYDLGNKGKTETFALIIERAEPEFTVADVNGDGNISIVDARNILQAVANVKTLTDTQKKAADLNGDGKITIVDAKWVLQIIAGLRDGETLKLK